MQTKIVTTHDTDRGLWWVEVFAGMHCMMNVVAHNVEQLNTLISNAQTLEARVADLSESELQQVIAIYHGQQN